MSLINQVLKDLEQRREEPVSSAEGSIITMPRYTAAGGGNPFVVYVFGALLIILSLAIGFLVWDRLVEKNRSSAITGVDMPASIPAPASTVAFRPPTAVPATPPAVETMVTTETESISRPETVEKKRAQKIEPEKSTAAPVRAGLKKAAPVVASEDDLRVDDGVKSGTIEKQRRPLTEKQLAEQAFHKGYAALRKGQVQTGERFFRKALSSSPEHIRSREMLAGIYIKAGRYVEAAQLLKQGVAVNPDHSMFRKLYARVLLEQEGLDQAVAVLERSLPQISQDLDYYALLAALYQRQGRHENAVALYQNMLKQNAMVGIWWIGMGISLEKMNQSEAARKAYEKARASGTLAAQMLQYTDNRLAALNEIGYPDE